LSAPCCHDWYVCDVCCSSSSSSCCCVVVVDGGVWRVHCQRRVATIGMCVMYAAVVVVVVVCVVVVVDGWRGVVGHVSTWRWCVVVVVVVF